MRKRRQRDFWRPAWERRLAQVLDSRTSTVTGADALTCVSWQGALEQAREGDWSWLDELVQRVVELDLLAFAPPPELWPELDEFFAAPPDRRRGKKPRVDDAVADSIRAAFRHATTTPGVAMDDADNVLREVAPMTDRAARDMIARDCGLSPETVRIIVERKATYSKPRR
jgi:hypothetical protein